MKRQLKQVPEDQRQIVEKMMEENPDLLMTIAKEVQEEVQKGTDQMQAFMAVAQRHKDELQQLYKKHAPEK